MAQAGFTPISLYYSTTPAAAPSAGNLVAGELALNTVDGKLYFKNSSNVVTLLASAAGATGDVVGPASATDTAIALFDGTTGKLIKNSGVTIDGSNNVSGVAQLNATTADLTNIEVTNIKAKDGTAAATIADSTGLITVSTELRVDNLSLNGNTISSTDSNGNIVLAPNGTGDVQLDADTVRIGDSNANVTLTTNGTGDLILNTNSGTNSGSITIEDGVNGNIIIAPNGTGQVQITNAVIDVTTIEVTNINAKDGTASASIANSTGYWTFQGTGAFTAPKGTTGQQPGSSVTGMIRYNTTTNQFEGYSGSSPAWKSIGGSALSNDTSTASDLYPTFSAATTGTAENLYTSNAKLLYKPSTGEFKVSAPIASNGIMLNNTTVAASYTIATSTNGLSVGPITVDSGITVTVSSGQRWLVL